MKRLVMERVLAVERYRAGEAPEAICSSLGRSLRWLYKWVQRQSDGSDEWFAERSRKPVHMPRKTGAAVEELVVSIRRELERDGLFSGAQAVAWELEERGFEVPSVRTVNRILRSHGVFDQAKAEYVKKGRKYPAPEVNAPNDVHQADFVGPRYIRGDGRFYSLNAADVLTARASGVPIRTRSTDDVLRAFWSTWRTLGIPKVLQVDNELVFWGSRRHPRGMSQLLRLCLSVGIEPLFIPIREPWRNGTIENFNGHWQSKFLKRTELRSFDHLVDAAREFDHKLNSRWRYSKNGGAPANDVLRRANVQLTFPSSATPPRNLAKPERGRCHLIRLIRSDKCFDVFGERFDLPKSTMHEYAVGTIDVAHQTLTVSVDRQVVASFDYRLR